MNGLYPLTSAVILTDEVFQLYGGDLSKAAQAQRDAAYLIAERAASKDIGTLLAPTIVTGTHYFNPLRDLLLDYGYVQRVILIRFIDTEEDVYYSISGTANVHASLRNPEYGIVDIHGIFGNCNCASSARPYPYQVQVVYEAGLPTGTLPLQLSC